MAAMTMLNILPAFMVDQVKKQIKAKQKEIDAELEHAVDEMFAKLDTDHDGTINHDEVQSDYASESDTYLVCAGACIDPSMPPSQNMRARTACTRVFSFTIFVRLTDSPYCPYTVYIIVDDPGQLAPA